MTAGELADRLRRGPWQMRLHMSMTGWSIYQHRLVADRRIERLTKIPARQGKKIETSFFFEDDAVDVTVTPAAPGNLILGVREFADAEWEGAAP